jgi:hypothetical protein
MSHRAACNTASPHRTTHHPVLTDAYNGCNDVSTRIVLARAIALPRLSNLTERYGVDRIAGTLDDAKNALVG